MLAVFRRLSEVAIALILIVTPQVAGASGNVAIADLMRQADVVVVADVLGGSDNGSQITMSISIRRILNGPMTQGKVVAIQWQAPNFRNSAPLAPGKPTGLFFLRINGTGYTALPVISGTIMSSDLYLAIPAADLSGTYVYQDSAALADKLTAELAAAVNGLKNGDFAVGAAYLDGLESLKSPTLITKYNGLADAASPDAKALALAGLIRNGDVAALGRVQTENDSLTKSAQFTHIVNSICWYYRNSGTQSVSVLGTIAGNPMASIALQRCAVHALRSIHTKESLPALRQMLESSDQTIRYDAIQGLAAYANNLPIQTIDNTAGMAYLKPLGDGPFATSETRANMPSLPAFRANEQKYLTFWKQWWEQVQSKL